MSWMLQGFRIHGYVRTSLLLTIPTTHKFPHLQLDDLTSNSSQKPPLDALRFFSSSSFFTRASIFDTKNLDVCSGWIGNRKQQLKDVSIIQKYIMSWSSCDYVTQPTGGQLKHYCPAVLTGRYIVSRIRWSAKCGDLKAQNNGRSTDKIARLECQQFFTLSEQCNISSNPLSFMYSSSIRLDFSIRFLVQKQHKIRFLVITK